MGVGARARGRLRLRAVTSVAPVVVMPLLARRAKPSAVPRSTEARGGDAGGEVGGVGGAGGDEGGVIHPRTRGVLGEAMASNSEAATPSSTQKATSHLSTEGCRFILAWG